MVLPPPRSRPFAFIALFALLAFPEVAFGQSLVRAGQFTDAEWNILRAKYPSVANIDDWRPLTHPRATVTEVPSELGNQTLAAIGYVDVTAAPFSADPTGTTDATAALQAAIDFARDYRMVAYLPVGDYRISDTILLRQLCNVDSDGNISTAGDSYPVAVKGATPPSGARARLVLAEESPGFDDVFTPKRVVRFSNVNSPATGSTGDAFSVLYNMSWHSVDIVIEPFNPGAVAIFGRSAEGSTIQDVTIDATHGHTGLWGPPGSGGSTSGLTVIGGRVGVETRRFPDLDGPGSQPSPTFSDLTLRNQTEYAVYVLTRGAFVVSGFRFETNRPGALIGHREHWFAQPYDSTLVLVDGSIEYSVPNSSNVVVTQPDERFSRSYTWNNVYVRHAALADNITSTPANIGGWRHYRELAVHLQPTAWNDRPWNERIYLDGVAQTNNIRSNHVDGVAPPADLLDRHCLPKPFPSLDTPGAVLITSHGAVSEATDSRSAIVAAINAAGVNGTVIVPRGNFYARNTISLLANTRFVGIHPIFSQLRARDENTARFGANPSPATTGLPLLRTVDSATAAPVVGRLGLHAPRAVRQHAAVPVGVYPLLWRSGEDSVFNTVRFATWAAQNWRLSSVLSRSTIDGGLGLAQTASPLARAGGLTFAEAHVLPSLIFESFASGPRLMTKHADPVAKLTLTRTGGGTFDLTSLEVSHAGFDLDPQYPITATATFADSSTTTATYNFATDGQLNLRDLLYPFTLNWTSLTKVELTAPHAFGIDNLVTNLGTETFSSVSTSSSISVFSGDYRRGFEHYPFAAQVHPQVLVTGNGGGKWFNLWYHGDVWAKADYRHVLFLNNQSRLDIHHWHLQHIHADAQAEIRGGQRISVYGIKHEHNCRFMDVVNSEHIRIFGNGGISSANPGEAHFRFVDSENFLVAGGGDEVHLNASGNNINTNDNPLIWWDPSLYDGIEEIRAGVRLAPATYERPLLYQRGQPVVAPAVARPVDTWLTTAGLAADANLTADPSGAGVALLLRYASGLGATAAPRLLVAGTAAGLPIVEGTATSAALRFRRLRTDPAVTYTAEYGSSVGTWQAVPAGNLSVVVIDATWEEVTATAPVTVNDRTFLRLRVELTP